MQLFRYSTRFFLNNYLYPSNKKWLSTISSNKEPFLMVASVGNPEPEYSRTRHNVGHWVLQQLVDNHWTNFQAFQKHRNITKGKYSVSGDSSTKNVILYKSDETYMNLQGEPIYQNWKQIQRIQAEQYNPVLVIIHDEILLQLGKIQIRRRGTSARGHNGLRSLDKIIGPNYLKIAVGVGKPPNKYVADYVLANFKKPELEVLTYDVMPKVVQALEEFLEGKHIYDGIIEQNDLK